MLYLNIMALVGRGMEECILKRMSDVYYFQCKYFKIESEP